MVGVELEVVILLGLILANGVLAMSEMALVSVRAARLEPLAKEGDSRAQVVLDLVADPGTFLSTVQIGVTLIGILIGVFSGGVLAQAIGESLGAWPLLARVAQPIGIGFVVIISTYLSLILGELVPKRLGLRYAERIAMAVAPPLRRMAQVASPLVGLLAQSTRLVLKILRVPTTDEPAVSEEEVRFMLRQGTDIGVFEQLEHDMVGRVFRLADQKLSALLTPRPELVWLDVNDEQEEILTKVIESGRSRFPVAEGDADRVVGIVLAKDLLALYAKGEPIELRSIMRPAIFVPETAPALTVVERMKHAQTKIAMVIDEYGGLAGLVTIDDVMEAIVGEILEEDELIDPMAVERPDGSWLIDGMMTSHEFFERFEIADEGLPGVVTVGGLVMAALGKVPETGDAAEWAGLTLEVVDMDGRRVDKVLVRRVMVAAMEEESGASNLADNSGRGRSLS